MILENVSCVMCGGNDARPYAAGIDFEYHCAPDTFNMVICNNCRLVYLNPRPAPTELACIYPENYAPYRYDEYLTPATRRLRMLLQRTKVRAIRKYAGPGAVIMDVGCGGGFLLECMKSHGPASWKLVGVEISESAVSKMRTAGIEAIQGRFEALDLPVESADLIILNQVIEHLDNPAAVVARAHDILRSGGHIFIETPSLDGRDAALFRSRCWGGWHFPRHWTVFSRDSLSRLLLQNGFEIVEHKWLISPNHWAQSIHHWLIDRGVSERIAGIMDCRHIPVLAFFIGIDLMMRIFGGSSNMRIVARKT